MTTIDARDPALPKAQGLYDPSKEHDSCGVGFVADLHNRKSHDIVEMGLQILLNLDHRGAVGADPKLGDGCGILVQIPHEFFAEECAEARLRAAGARPLRHRPVLPPARRGRARQGEGAHRGGGHEPGAVVLGWRDMPVDFERSRRGGEGGRAGPRAGVHRPRPVGDRRRRFRAPPLSRAQDRLE